VRLLAGVATVDDLDGFLEALDSVAAAHDVTVQAFDGRYVVDRAHLERAVELADRAFARGENVARDRGVEILLYAAGRRQIDDALAMGVGEGRGPLVVVVTAQDGDEGREAAAVAALGDRLDVDPATAVDATDPERVRAFFDVTDAELAAVDGDLADLVRERVALLDVEK
jgi:KEOPS complex subunit Cgi121